MSNFKKKYIKYKKKYLEFKNKMKGGSEADDFKKAIEASKRTALREDLIRELRNKIFLNNSGEKKNWEDLTHNEKETIIKHKILEKERPETKKQKSKTANTNSENILNKLYNLISETVKSIIPNEINNSSISKAENQDIEKANALSIKEKKRTEARERKAQPVSNSKQKKLNDIKDFNDVPADGFCGYWCIYNALYSPEILRTKARPEFKIGILDEKFRIWLNSILELIKRKHNGKDIKEVTGLLEWLNKYNDYIGTEAKAGQLRKYFTKNGDFNNKDYDLTRGWVLTKRKISDKDFKLLNDYTRQLPEELWSTDTILGIISKIEGINIIMTHPKAGYLFPNGFDIKKDTLLIHTNGMHWTWKRISSVEIHLYLDDINEKLDIYAEVEQALRNKYLKYKKKYLLLKSKLK